MSAPGKYPYGTPEDTAEREARARAKREAADYKKMMADWAPRGKGSTYASSGFSGFGRVVGALFTLAICAGIALIVAGAVMWALRQL